MALYPPDKPSELRGISLCAGVAGLDLGLHLAEPGYRTVCYVERNSFAAATIVARMADASLAQAPVWDDLKSFDGRPWRGRVHIVSAGYPCQPFTLSGVRKGNADPRHLWPEVARITREIAPEYVFFENVPGHLSLGFQDVARDLQEMGYGVAARVVSAAEVGASHTRERLFILGHANLQDGRQSRLCGAESEGAGVQERSESDGHPNRPEVAGDVLDAALGPVGGDGLDRKDLPLFPPLPGDIAEWREKLEKWPELKPCLLRLDDGLASAVDRNAAAGNGVVPMAAARAWRVLRGKMR